MGKERPGCQDKHHLKCSKDNFEDVGKHGSCVRKVAAINTTKFPPKTDL